MTKDTTPLWGTPDFRESYPAGAAHAASEYDDAAPEGAAICIAWVLLALAAVLGLAAWTVFY